MAKQYQIFFNDNAAEDAFYSQVAEVVVEDNADRADSFRLKLALRQMDDGSWSAVDDDRLTLFTKVRIEAGFSSGNTEVLTEGYITAIKLHLEDPAQNPYLEVDGLDASVLMSLEEKIVAWPNLSDSDIATQVLSSYGFTPDVASTNPVHQDTDVTLIQRSTDLQWLRQLARKNGFEVGVERDFTTGQVVGYFRTPALGGTPQPVLSVAFGDRSSLKSFDVHVDGLRPLDVETTQLDIKAKAANTGTASSMSLSAIGARNLEDLAGGPIAALISPKVAVGKLWLHANPASDPAEITSEAQAVRDEAAWLVTARGEIHSEVYGTVLRANRLVLIRGAGSLYSGNYLVTRVVHRLTGDGKYEQSFQARRNAVGVDGSENFST